jgi:signal transduction histidine kinase
VAKYSGTKQFWVELTGTSNQVQLEVRDAGTGFDVEEASRNGGLGLMSMRERVRVVDGRLSLESRPGAGTKIVASVPLVAESGGSSRDLRRDQAA